MTATEFLNQNQDIRQFYYSQSWSGRSDWEILVNWVNMTTERTPRYYTAKEIVSGGGDGGNGGGDIIPGISNTMLLLLAAAGVAVYFFVLKKK